MRILLTGAKGFIGETLGTSALGAGYEVRATSRNPDHINILRLRPILDGVDVIIHSAGRADTMGDASKDALRTHRRINAKGTERLAQTAVANSVKRVIHLSSIKVNGERTARGKDGARQREGRAVLLW